MPIRYYSPFWLALAAGEPIPAAFALVEETESEPSAPVVCEHDILSMDAWLRLSDRQRADIVEQYDRPVSRYVAALDCVAADVFGI